MKRISSYILVGFTLMVALMASCSGKKSKDGRTDTLSSGKVSFYSDESFSPIIGEELQVFSMSHPDAHLTPIYSNETDGIQKLLEGKCWLVFASRSLSKGEMSKMAAQSYQPQNIKIAYDALALIVNKQSKDTLISVQDLKDILLGKATQWSDVRKGSKQGEITVVFDNPKSSTVRFIQDSVLGGKKITNPNVAAVNKTAEVIKYVEENPGAIGIIGNNWLNDKRDTTNLTFNRNIRVMSVSKLHPATAYNSRKPYQYYIWNGEYPLIRTIYAILNDPRRALPTSFAHFVEQPDGQLIILKSGLLPMYGNINIRDVNVSE